MRLIDVTSAAAAMSIPTAASRSSPRLRISSNSARWTSVHRIPWRTTTSDASSRSRLRTMSGCAASRSVPAAIEWEPGAAVTIQPVEEVGSEQTQCRPPGHGTCAGDPHRLLEYSLLHQFVRHVCTHVAPLCRTSPPAALGLTAGRPSLPLRIQPSWSDQFGDARRLGIPTMSHPRPCPLTRRFSPRTSRPVESAR